MCVVLTLSACSTKNNELTVFPDVSDATAKSLGDVAAEEETLSDEEFKESLAVMAETLGDGYSLTAVENEDGGVEYKFVPTQFPVYRDGENHYLMYGANAATYMYAPFTSVTYPEYRIASISLPTQMVSPNNGWQTLSKEDLLKSSEMEKDVVYDTSLRYSIDMVPVYSIEASSFLFRTWSMPFEGDPDMLEIEGMHGLYTYPDKMYGMDEQIWEVSQLDDETYQYSTMCFLRDYVDDSAPNSYAKFTVVINDGRAYCYLAGGYAPETAFWLAEYVLRHSFMFK